MNFSPIRNGRVAREWVRLIVRQKDVVLVAGDADDAFDFAENTGRSSSYVIGQSTTVLPSGIAAGPQHSSA